MSRTLILSSVFVLLLLLCAAPIAIMAWESVQVNGHVSFEWYRQLLASPREWTLLTHSFILAIAVTGLTVALGVPIGILIAKTDLLFRNFFAAAFAIPLLIPSYISAVGWSSLVGAGGILAPILGPTNSQFVADLLFGLPGCVFILTSAYLPIIILMTMTSLVTIQPQLEEAAQLAMPKHMVLRHITIPLIVPALSFAVMLVFLLVLGEYGVPNFLRYDVFAVESMTFFTAFYNFSAATAAALPLAIITGFILWLEWILLRDRFHELSTPSKMSRPNQFQLGNFRIPITLIVGIFCFVIVWMPLVILLLQSHSLATYLAAMEIAAGALGRSFLYAILGSSILVVVGFFIGYLIHHRSLPTWKLADTLLIFFFALPGTVIGIALVLFWNRPWMDLIYGTTAMVMIGYVIKYTALTSRITASSLARISPSLEEAGELAGLSWFHRLEKIVVPVVKRGIIAGWLITYIFCMRDIELTMIIYPAGGETLPVRISTLMANGAPELISALCVIMVIATLLPPAMIWFAAKNTFGDT